MNKLLTYVTQSTALLAVVATLGAPCAFAETMPTPSAAMVEQVLQDKMGEAAKDLTATVEQGTVNLSGWAYGPREVHQARYLASQIPGVQRAYSSLVRTWVSTDPTPVF